MRQQLHGVNQSPRHYAFQHPGLDRAEHLREDRAVLARHWPDAWVMLVDIQGQAIFSGGGDTPVFPRGGELFSEIPEDASFLGIDGEQVWFALPAERLGSLPGPALDLRSAAAQWPAAHASIFAQARALLHWQQRNKFCGGCGQALRVARGGFTASCTQCGLEHYPRTDPAIIVAVSDGERLLLGRQASWPERQWSVLAGFLEPGESLEQTVVREVMEEAGVLVHDCRYAGSQPWPFPSALMLGFHALARAQPVRVGAELQDARWFSATQLREQIAAGEMRISPRLSISRWLIDDWLAAH